MDIAEFVEHAKNDPLYLATLLASYREWKALRLAGDAMGASAHNHRQQLWQLEYATGLLGRRPTEDECELVNRAMAGTIDEIQRVGDALDQPRP